MTTIIGIKVANREETSKTVQEVLTEFGCKIKTRLGINDYKEGECTYQGIILIEIPDTLIAKELEKRLNIIQNVTVKTMKF